LGAASGAVVAGQGDFLIIPVFLFLFNTPNFKQKTFFGLKKTFYYLPAYIFFPIGWGHFLLAQHGLTGKKKKPPVKTRRGAGKPLHPPPKKKGGPTKTPPGNFEGGIFLFSPPPKNPVLSGGGFWFFFFPPKKIRFGVSPQPPLRGRDFPQKKKKSLHSLKFLFIFSGLLKTRGPQG